MGQDLQLLITLNLQNGQVSVSGPIDNKMMAYGMLAAAKDAIYDFGKQQENRVQLASPAQLPPLV